MDWKNDIFATYDIKKAYNSKLMIEDIAQKMADGISIGTTQEAQDIYTPKTPATHINSYTFKPGYLRASVEHCVKTGEKTANIQIRFSSQIQVMLVGSLCLCLL